MHLHLQLYHVQVGPLALQYTARSTSLVVQQDMVMWVRKHNQLLAGPNGSLQEAFTNLAAQVQEGQAAPEAVQGSVMLL